MQLLLIEETKHTRIKVPLKSYTNALYKSTIEHYIQTYGGREIKRSTRFIYFEIDTDLLNMHRSGA